MHMMQRLREITQEGGANKGDDGRVGAIAGSLEYAGPPVHTGTAALRSGADLVRVMTSERVLQAVASHENLLVSPYAGDRFAGDSVDAARDLIEWSDVVVVGPGLADPETDAVAEVIEAVTGPLIVDADAISPAMAADTDFDNAVFTPDTAEIERIESEHDSVDAFAERTGATVLITGDEDEVVTAEGRETVETGSPAMTVGGTGDVLAGVVASLIGQGVALDEAATLGAWTLGRAGELATEEHNKGLVATDIVERLPRAMR